MDVDIFEDIITILVAFVASSGFWSFLQSRKEKKDAKENHNDDKDRLILAMAQDKIVYLGMSYIERGFMTKEEHDILLSVYEPYQRLGGNGTAKKVVDECLKLPFCRPVHFEKEGKNANKQSDV